MPLVEMQASPTKLAVEGFAKAYANNQKIAGNYDTAQSFVQSSAQTLFNKIVSQPDGDGKMIIQLPAGATEEKTVPLVIPKKREPWEDVPVLDLVKDTVVSIQIISDKRERILPPYTQFYITGISETNQEKFQVVETFDEPNFYFYGSRPKIYQFTGVLKNESIGNWAHQFMLLWETVLKGTRLAEMKAKAYLFADNVTYIGYPISTSMSKQAQSPYGVPFSMNFLLARKTIGGKFDKNLVSDLNEASKFFTDEDTKKKYAETQSLRKVSEGNKIEFYFEFPKT